MAQLSRFVEEIHLGTVHDPHTDRPFALTELVTVCPACLSLHSLRQEDIAIRCVECLWTVPAHEPVQVA